jgi:HEAT repeat protein
MIITDIAYCSDGDSAKIIFDPEMTQEAADSLVDRLFIQASSGEIKYRDLVQPSKDSIASLGEKALPQMCAKLTARDARERWTISDIFRALGKIATDSLISYLGSDRQYVLLNVGRCLGQIKDTSSTMACLPLLRHEKYPVRSQFAATLGKNEDPRAVEDLMAVLDADLVDDVRKSAAVALGRIADSRAAAILIAHLADPYFGVRKTASRALVQFTPVPIADIARAADMLSDLGPGMAIETLGQTDDEKAEKYLLKFLESSNPRIRGYTIDALAALNTEGAKRTLRALEESTVPRSLFERARLRAALSRLMEEE